VDYYYGKQTTTKRVDIPASFSLGLNKIILLKNDDVIYNKSNGVLLEQYNEGEVYIANSYTSVTGYLDSRDAACQSFYFQPLYEKTYAINQIKSNQHQNILDVKDIESLNLESKAQQIIEFNHDYSLAKNSPNSDDPNQGRLTLKNVNFNGKQGMQLVPPYKFSYLNYVVYYKDKIDEWGYYNNAPYSWSLNEIQTPTGGKIKIDYESDSYFAEAASYESKYFENISFSKTGSYIELTFN